MEKKIYISNTENKQLVHLDLLTVTDPQHSTVVMWLWLFVMIIRIDRSDKNRKSALHSAQPHRVPDADQTRLVVVT